VSPADPLPAARSVRSDLASIFDALYDSGVPRRPSARARVPSRSSARSRRRFEERDRRIREAAQRLLLERGLHAFSMDDVADAIDYSKGTVYLHYASKEDALIASCTDACTELAGWFERAATTPGRPRARMVAIAESYVRFVREREVSFRLIPLIQSPTVLERVSPPRLEEMDAAHERVVGACLRIVKEAVAAGDLSLPRGTTPETVTFALWATVFGAYLLEEIHRPEGLLGVRDPAATIRSTWAAHMDGLGWRPLSKEKGYEAACRRALDGLGTGDAVEPAAGNAVGRRRRSS
jgi:AcrR family transcriptional regulator